MSTPYPRAVFPELEYVDLDGVRLAYREWGTSVSGPPVVLVHGITSNALSWARVGPALAEAHRVIAPDLKGHGDSDKPAGGYANAQIAAEVARLCNSLGVKRIAVVGHSWGGAIGVLLATSTDLVERLVLEDPVLQLLEERRSEFSAQFSLTVGLDPAEAKARYNATTVPAGWTEVDIAGKVEAAVKGSPDAVRAVFAENAPWDLRERLAQITCPTLMLNASRE
ncbi:MAG TPA: alpha/beta hydrolase, partial [Chloroflexota bacterium]|nr:alpha/beta hydrolase [Chloroflexota bacterium]